MTISPRLSGIGSLLNAAGPERMYRAYFAGPKAATAEDVPRERLFQDPSGMVRFEQPDNEAVSTITRAEDYPASIVDHSANQIHNKDDPYGNIMPLGELYSHPTLYTDYPHLTSMPVMLLPSLGTSTLGSYATPDAVADGSMEKYLRFMEDPEEARNALAASPYGAFVVNPAYTLSENPEVSEQGLAAFIRRVMAHETQHAIDEYEGADYYGATPRKYKTRPGEAVARMVQDRLDLPDDERFDSIGRTVVKPMRENAAWANPIPKPGLWEALMGPDYDALYTLMMNQRSKD